MLKFYQGNSMICILLFPHSCKLYDLHKVQLVIVFTALCSTPFPVLLFLATRSRLRLATCVVTDIGVMFSKAEQVLLPSPLKSDSTLSPGHFVKRIHTPAPYSRLILSHIRLKSLTVPTDLFARLFFRDV
jgi:hypothetical protein